MFSKYLKTLSILKKFLFINFVIFTIIGLFTFIYLKNIQPSLIKKKSQNHTNIINNTIDNILRLDVKFQSDDIRRFLFSTRFIFQNLDRVIFFDDQLNLIGDTDTLDLDPRSFSTRLDKIEFESLDNEEIEKTIEEKNIKIDEKKPVSFKDILKNYSSSENLGVPYTFTQEDFNQFKVTTIKNVTKNEINLGYVAITENANEIKTAIDFGVEVAVVIGGGNIFRGVQVEGQGLDRVQGDYMGMLATIINGMALQSALEKADVETRLLTAIKMEQVAEPFIRRRAMRHLQKGRVVIFGGGTGNPYFTTDTAATLRAIEIEADVILKGTRVDGIYTADPEKDKSATKYDTITFKEVYEKELNIMDMTAFTLCNENKLPIVVFDINKKQNLYKMLHGESVGTLVNF